MKEKILTGLKPTGELHLGNYVGAIRPALEITKKNKCLSYFFIADSHSLTLQLPSDALKDFSYKVAASWLACGLDPKKTVFYRQSDIPELFELAWILSCVSPKGLLNRSHAYKAKKDQNLALRKKDLDHGINMGLYNYPILMGADILLFSATHVPVGQDQIQHLEMIRDIAQKWNHLYKKALFTLPKAVILKKNSLPGIDGQKMSKSYQNEIPMFINSEKRKARIQKIKTNSKAATEPKETQTCLIFQIYKNFATEKELLSLEKAYAEGISWASAKEILFEKLENQFKEKKKLYDYYLQNPKVIDQFLETGKDQARTEAQTFLKEIKNNLGLKVF